MTTQPLPPPPNHSLGRLRNLRIAGFILAISFPITGILSFAAAAIILGEGRLENSSGVTPVGWFFITLPAVLGLALLAWTYSRFRLPTTGEFLTASAVLAALAVGLGVWSIISSSGSGDASIGGGLLVAAGLVGGAAALWRLLGPSAGKTD